MNFLPHMTSAKYQVIQILPSISSTLHYRKDGEAAPDHGPLVPEVSLLRGYTL
jgi:hypothetical protein